MRGKATGWDAPDCRFGFICSTALDIGIGSISWQTLNYYQNVKAPEMTIWESDVLMMLGREFSDALHEYQGKPCDPPWSEYKVDQNLIAEAMRATLLG